MNRISRLVGLALINGMAGCRSPQPAVPANRVVEVNSGASASQHTFVLVHGAWGGSWDWRTVDSLLRHNGQVAYRPSLTGLGERVHLASPTIGLSTHVTDVVNAILYENLRDVILVGHSYGGMVISGVADRVPDRIRHLVFVDAFVPEDGESVVDAARGTKLDGFARTMVSNAKDGFIIPLWTKPSDPVPHDVPQPVKTFTEPVVMRNPAARRIPGTYILTVDSGAVDDDFSSFAERAKQRGWRGYVMRGNHVVERSAPGELVRLLLQVP